jgi:hypothetical protein
MSWSSRAREHIRKQIAAHPELREDIAGMLDAIDASYPFGERAYHPYKVWLKERRKAIAELADAAGLSDPLVRPCPACGAGIKRLCRDIDGSKFFAENRAVADDADAEGKTDVAMQLRAMSIHEARLPDGVLLADLPLFSRAR